MSIDGPVHMFFRYGDFGEIDPIPVLESECFIGRESEGERPTEMFEVLDVGEYTMWCKGTETVG